MSVSKTMLKGLEPTRMLMDWRETRILVGSSPFSSYNFILFTGLWFQIKISIQTVIHTSEIIHFLLHVLILVQGGRIRKTTFIQQMRQLGA